MIPINDLSARLARHASIIDNAVRQVVDSGWWVLGPRVQEFERQFAGYLGVSDCVGVANGTDAIELALRALGVGPGVLVATVANAGMYATAALLAAGGGPWFMDVDADSHLVTVAEVERALSAGVRVIVVTHLYGRAVAEMAVIAELCRRHGAHLIEDCAQAHGASIDGRRAGSFGNAATFSFYPTKNLGALGDGGAVATDDPELARRLRQLRQYGWGDKYHVEVAGGRNSRLDEMQAAILVALLPDLDCANARRHAIAQAYGMGIRHALVEAPLPGPGDVAHLYVLRCRNRQSLREHLSRAGIATDVHYPVADHRQPVFAGRYAEVELEQTERLTSEILTLPCYPELADQQVAAVINAVNGWSP